MTSFYSHRPLTAVTSACTGTWPSDITISDPCIVTSAIISGVTRRGAEGVGGPPPGDTIQGSDTLMKLIFEAKFTKKITGQTSLEGG